MKKLVTLFAILALAIPALAAVDVTCADQGDNSGWFTISYDASGEAELVSGFGLDVTTDGANIVEIEYVAGSPYNIYPGTIVISGGAVAEDGNAVAPSDACEALGGLGTTGVTLEMAALYDRDDANLAPAASGALVKLKLDASGEVTLGLNDRRGGVVLEDAVAANVPAAGCSVSAGPGCWRGCQPCGDFNNDGIISPADASGLIAAWSPNPYEACADFNHDGIISPADASILIAHWSPNENCPAGEGCTP
jgi:hypothetical protein